MHPSNNLSVQNIVSQTRAHCQKKNIFIDGSRRKLIPIAWNTSSIYEPGINIASCNFAKKKILKATKCVTYVYS